MPKQQGKAGAEQEKPTHPLLSRNIRPLRNWHEWLARWEAAVSMEEMLGLLHTGFSDLLSRHEYGEPKYDGTDRLLCYFYIADGWEDHELLELPTDRGIYYSWRDADGRPPSKLRQQIARKAFDMLCPNFFKNPGGTTAFGPYGNCDREHVHYWESIVASERLLPVIQNFFRAEKERYGDSIRIRNLTKPWVRVSRSHNEELAIGFLLNLARFLWGHKVEVPPHYGDDEELKTQMQKEYAALRARIEDAKPWMIEVLALLDKLDILRERILELDAPCLKKLEEIALRTKMRCESVSEPRQARTLNEACYAGSRAAWFLKKYALLKAEHERLTAIRDAEREKAAADRKLKKLSTTR